MHCKLSHLQNNETKRVKNRQKCRFFTNRGLRGIVIPNPITFGLIENHRALMNTSE